MHYNTAMKYMKQLSIILLISFIGELMHMFIPIPVPASIYGLVILFACLELKIVKLSAVKEVSGFLIEIMALTFIPAAVGLMDSWSLLEGKVAQYVVIMLVTTVLVMAVSGRVTQRIIRLKRKGGEEHE